MEKEKAFYEELVANILKKYPETYEGEMMSSPGVKFNDKVFVFHYKNEMVFRLGPDFDPVAYQIKNPKPLNPFKTKPPLKGWFVVSYEEKDKWLELSELAYEFVQTI